jgi:hypothetical protein
VGGIVASSRASRSITPLIPPVMKPTPFSNRCFHPSSSPGSRVCLALPLDRGILFIDGGLGYDIAALIAEGEGGVEVRRHRANSFIA